MYKKLILRNLFGVRKCQNSFFSTSAVKRNTDIIVDQLKENNSGIFIISFNRPTVKNAVSRNMMKELSETFDKLHFNKKVRVLILRSSSPGIFCAGADLKERLTLSPDETYQTVCKFRWLTSQIESTPFPVIAAVDGFALGGGFEIALACDIKVASTEAKFGLVETKLAIIPGAGGTQRLPRTVGASIAKELIFTGRIIDATSAKEYGILNHVVEQNESRDAAFNKALQISQEILPNGPLGVKMAKTAINKGLEVDMSTGCSIEENCYARVIPTLDRMEGLNAFVEKRKPKYKGE